MCTSWKCFNLCLQFVAPRQNPRLLTCTPLSIDSVYSRVTSDTCVAFSLNARSDIKALEGIKNIQKTASTKQQQGVKASNTLPALYLASFSPSITNHWFEYAFQSSHLHLFVCKIAQACVHVLSLVFPLDN